MDESSELTDSEKQLRLNAQFDYLEDAGINVRDALKLRTVLTKETDRGCALMSAAFLDDQLKKLIGAFLVDDKKVSGKLFNGYSPLATFSSRIDMAYVLGLISKETRLNLTLLRKIRNDFAHIAEDISFDTENIANRCREFTLDGQPSDTQPRKKFVIAMMGIASQIAVSTVWTEHLEPRPDPDIEAWKKRYKELWV